jgi:hypothetical protein
MSIQDFLLALGVGSALIAFWFVVRFPERCPQSFRTALLHVVAALTFGWVAPDLFNALSAHGFASAIAAVFTILLPALVYTFLSGAWVLKLMHDAFSTYGHR